MDSRFGSIDGVIRTTVGYTGGTSEQPTYYSMGGHSESVQVVFDPKRVSYEDLLKVFWASHVPTAVNRSRQYMNAVFYHDDRQRDLAETSREGIVEWSRSPVNTMIAPAGPFYPAEDYHQKYLLRSRSELQQEIRRRYPSEEAFAASTAAARVNGYLGGYGSMDQLISELDALALSPEGRARLLDSARHRLPSHRTVPHGKAVEVEIPE